MKRNGLLAGATLALAVIGFVALSWWPSSASALGFRIRIWNAQARLQNRIGEAESVFAYVRGHRVHVCAHLQPETYKVQCESAFDKVLGEADAFGKTAEHVYGWLKDSSDPEQILLAEWAADISAQCMLDVVREMYDHLSQYWPTVREDIYFDEKRVLWTRWEDWMNEDKAE